MEAGRLCDFNTNLVYIEKFQASQGYIKDSVF